MILSYEDGNTSYAKPNTHKPTIWAKCSYTQCVVVLVTIMVFTKACLGSGFPELSNVVCGPMYHAYVHPVKIKNQCLFLDTRLTHDICVDKRTSRLPDIHLKFCNMYTLSHTIPQNESEIRMGVDCNETLVDLVRSDKNASEEFQLFTSVLQRVDCDTEYSVKWSCSVCRVSTIVVSSSFLPGECEPAIYSCKSVVYLLEEIQLTIKSVPPTSGDVAKLSHLLQGASQESNNLVSAPVARKH